MDPNNRYFITKSLMAERMAEAQRARLVKGDLFVEDVSGAPARLVTREPFAPGLLNRLRGIHVRRSAQRHAAV
jgi:hypothetical protein